LLEKKMALIRGLTRLSQPQTQDMEQRLRLHCNSSYRWQSGLKQRARRDEQAAHALHVLTAALMEHGGCRIHAPRPSTSRPASQQLKRAQRRRLGCSLPVTA
jgi:hypothetical protein